MPATDSFKTNNNASVRRGVLALLVASLGVASYGAYNYYTEQQTQPVELYSWGSPCAVTEPDECSSDSQCKGHRTCTSLGDCIGISDCPSTSECNHYEAYDGHCTFDSDCHGARECDYIDSKWQCTGNNMC
mmetsp:Transcript_40867/g.62292  ORF Transcript_40867/g.62292 Transcript_40867/m.62292 type:complete len:131 (-) Transcript_40867:69-461(-)